MKQKRLGYSVDGSAIKLTADKENYRIGYQKNILERLGKENSGRIAENLLYLLTVHKAVEGSKLEYPKKPFFEKLINHGILKDIPRAAEQAGADTKHTISAFEKRKIIFRDNYAGTLSIGRPNKEDSAVLSMSFGKDSLLSFGLAKEIGFDVGIVFFNDTAEINNMESMHKLSLISKFNKEMKERAVMVYDNTDKMFKGTKLAEEFAATNAMLSYALELIPIACGLDSKYLLLGNEQNLNDTFVNKDGFTAYPSYDQSNEYIDAVNGLLENFGGGFRVLSLINPIYAIAEYKILKNRYPHLLRYVMSCSGSKKGRWCYSCPTCAKTYMYACAVGLEPKKMMFEKNLFGKESKPFYPVFSKPTRAYEKPTAVRDEQLYSFYLAHKNGARGYLIDEFKKHYLGEAREREEEFHRRFFGIYPSSVLPSHLPKDVTSIYGEELSSK